MRAIKYIFFLFVLFYFVIITEKPVEVLRVATKGQDEAGTKGWVTKYLISLSTNGSIFTYYIEGGKEKVSLLFISPPSPQFIQPINPGIPIWRMQDSCLIIVCSRVRFTENGLLNLIGPC